MQTETTQNSTLSKEESQLVTFLLKDEEFGFDIMSVQEIIRLPKMAKVPRTPAYVEGIANLRGIVLPIIDMRKRFGMEHAEDTDRTRILVVDIEGVKTGLRVDRVQQVTRVQRGDVEPPPQAIRGTTADYLDGVVKLNGGQRIIMALNAAQVCKISVAQKAEQQQQEATTTATTATTEQGTAKAADAVQQMVTFRIANEEFAFAMEHVREILRVQAPKQVPDVPKYVLGVLTVRGQILPIVDLRRLLNQQSLAEEFAEGCQAVRNHFEAWTNTVDSQSQERVADLAAPERLRAWVSGVNSSSQILMERAAKLRGLNERLIKQAQSKGSASEVTALAGAVISALRDFEQNLAANLQEDQRIIVVAAHGTVTGLVVDHVNEVMNVSKSLLHAPPTSSSDGGTELSAVAKLDDGKRLIMLLDAAHLLQDRALRVDKTEAGAALQPSSPQASAGANAASNASGQVQERSEIQLVTFLLSGEEYGVPISKIQEIDRLAKITKVPKAAAYVEGVTNLRGEVIPVLDTRKRFGLETKAADDRSRIMIVDLGGVKTGLIVDSVREVISLSKGDISPPPEAIHSGIDQRFVSGIGRVNGGQRMVVLLDVEKILSKGEQSDLGALAVSGDSATSADLLRLQETHDREGVLTQN